MDADYLALGGVWYVVFLLSLTCHEAAHALAAKLGGDETAAAAGQVTLNPVPHIRREPFGTILIPLLSYMMSGWMMGWASAPHDPRWAQRYPRRAAWMALAGPAANFGLALIGAGALVGGSWAGWFHTGGSVRFAGLMSGRTEIAEGFAVFSSILFSLNLLLGVFNLLPLAPLDGNSAIALILPESAAAKFFEISRGPTFSMIGLLVAWQLFDRIFSPVYGAVVGAVFRAARG